MLLDRFLHFLTILSFCYKQAHKHSPSEFKTKLREIILYFSRNAFVNQLLLISLLLAQLDLIWELCINAELIVRVIEHIAT